MATILIVDDLSANRQFLVTLLSHHGHQCLQATDGSEGLASVRAHQPDLVITDVLMPVMDGFEFVRQLRLNPATSGIPVVFYTAHYGEREARALALSSGVSHVLKKPAPSEEVLAIVDRALSGESETGKPLDAAPLTIQFDRDHLRLITDKLSEKAGDLRIANARLRALINLGLDLASERNPDQLLLDVCGAAQELFGATYVSLGVLELPGGRVERFVSCGSDAPPWMHPGDMVSGLLAAVIADRLAWRGDNPDGDPSRLQLPVGHPDVLAYLVAPIASPLQVYGWIFLAQNEGRDFSEEDEQLVLALGGQVGRIYENGHFVAVAQQRAEQLEHEILERKQAEAAVRRERDRARQYLDTAEVILLALDLEGRVKLINRKACDLLGWTEAELMGRDWIDTCLPERIRAVSRERLHRVVEGNLPTAENPVLTRGGEERLIEWHNTVLRDDEGRVSGSLSSGADITERHQAVEALKTAEERMRFALQSAKVGIWDMDYATGANVWSNTLEAQYGLQPGVYDGTFEAFANLIHPEDREAALEVIGKSMKSGEDFSIEHRTIWPDGTVHWLQGAGRVLLGAQGQPLRAVGISQDVTERRTLEDQYQQAQKMEAIGRLAGGVAHDFNNLLTAILGYCELLLADLEPEDRHRADISEIQRAGASAAELTRQLLAFSRKQLIEPTLLDLNIVVTDLQPMLGRLIGEDVEIVVALRPGLALVKADRGQIEQIVMNLAVNARDAMPGGGRLTIETANVELDENYPKTHLSVTPGHYVVLTATDTGTGMTPQVQARLFEPFFTTKEPGRGTGLGLATVHGIVARSGGSINFYSELGRGTSFKVYFPQADPAEAVAEPAPLPVRAHDGGQTVLLVEDSEGLRDLTRRLLERQGYTVLVAANAEEALGLFARHQMIDVLLTDVVMPGASGPELTRQLIEQRPGLKVVYMSGYTEESIVHHGVINPGIAFLHKPFTSVALGRKLREVLDREVLV